MTGPPAPIAGFHFDMPPADSHGTGGQRSLGFQANYFAPVPPKYTLELSPLFGQTFFGPTAASAAAPPVACHRGVTMLEPVLSPPNINPLARAFALAAAGAVDSRDQLLPVGAVHMDAGPPVFPLCSPPVALVARAAKVECPKLALGAVFGDTWTADTASPAPAGRIGDLRHVPLASWTRANLEPLWQAGKIAGTARELPLAAAAIATHNGSCLRLTRCAPPSFAAPLLAEDTIQRGKNSPANIETNTLDREVSTRLPGILAGTATGLAPEAGAIWKLNPASPWNLTQPSQAQAIAPAPAGAMMPALRLAPVRPGLAAESEVRHVTARPQEMLAPAARMEGKALGVPERPAVPPAIAAHAAVPALPGAFAPHLFQADAVRAQEIPAAPAPAGEMPIAGRLSASDPLLLSPLGQAGAPRPESAGPMAPAMPAFVPQAAAPRYSSELAVREPHTSTAVPTGTVAGFARTSFTAIAPAAVEQTLRPIRPTPETVQAAPLAFRGAQLAVSHMGIAGLQGVVPLDVYVQRVKATPRRDCQWKTSRMPVVPPTALPGVWPARFEQLVLQDWRRRYPARQMAVAPAPIVTGARILPMARNLPALARFRQNAPHFVKGLAAAAFIGAILWFSMSTETVRTTVTTDRHWLRTAISRRATIFHDDNFRAGLNLWEGRKNWAQSWSYSADGFMRTGQLALYRPTLKMDNYKLEFFGQIESKSLGWVFRAKDEQNYYAMKLSVTEPGPRPLVSVVRYPVLNGVKGKRVQIPLPIMMHNNTPYHVALDVKGSRFRAFVEDQEVDSWTDDKLRAGGVGFFSETGEHARLYWVKVSHNTDWLGRLCGMLSGNETSQDSADLWNPAEARTLAMLDRGSIMDGAKNVDRRRGVMTGFRPTLPLATVFLGDSF